MRANRSYPVRWQESTRRILTHVLVISIHLGAWLLFFGARVPTWSLPQSRADHRLDSLRIRFLPTQTPSLARAPPARGPRPHHLPTPTPRSQTAEVAPLTPARAAPRIVVSLPPELAVDQAAPDYQARGFRGRLRDAQHARSVPMPGAAAPRVGGLALRVAPSVRDIARRLTVATRCSAERFDMQKSKNQFITTQLMDRALEADGCGPHARRMPASDAVDALTRKLTGER